MSDKPVCKCFKCSEMRVMSREHATHRDCFYALQATIDRLKVQLAAREAECIRLREAKTDGLGRELLDRMRHIEFGEAKIASLERAIQDRYWRRS